MNPARSTRDQLSVIDSLNALPFPEREERRTEGDIWSGPGYHVAVLRESRDFWEERGEEIVEEAEQEIEAALEALAATLTGRWGEPETVDLSPYLGIDSPDPGLGPDPALDLAVPEPMGSLCGLAGSMRVWRPAPAGRWLALAVGQADPEWPIQLLAAFGEASSLSDRPD
ncbi:hypothetical protein [Streptomyces sp. IB2014 016-6]|uniref:hypothetical protein n=1 Tax=Streptomyces sp. IB2014 016-6 TaxID=2517818 RepID=UPI0011C7BB16|nr:hypothetical protein [Streptomyces sp. IB2014 016-6]TXL87185.1 hypothetical protein EW053_23160 [Streptomyces sp. IB2014 016-6]